MNTQQEKLDAVVRAMARLPEIERKIIVLRIEGKTYKEIGETLKIHQPSASRAYARALSRTNKNLSL